MQEEVHSGFGGVTNNYNNYENYETKKTNITYAEIDETSPRKRAFALAVGSGAVAPKSDSSVHGSAKELCVGINTNGGKMEKKKSFLDLLEKATLKFYDNPATGKGRNRKILSMALEFNDESPDAKFLCNLTKDMRNYRKHHDERSKDRMIEQVNEIRKAVKEEGHSPYVGKFRTKCEGKKPGTIEPFTSAVLWYNKPQNEWHGIVLFYNWTHEFVLSINRDPKPGDCKGYAYYNDPNSEKVRGKAPALFEKMGFDYE